MTDISRLTASIADRYTIAHEIGRGGMATVYLARDVKHDRQVALKVLDPELGAVLGSERFLTEIKVTANLQHPNLLPLFDSGEASGLLFYVMPFVDGESLRARLEREKQLPVDEAIRITVAIASALDYAHKHGVIHRDLKPENILMQSGQPVIADFGIALAVSKAGGSRVTQTGLSLGTPQYMSPEQATGDRVIDGRSDIYSLAAMCYEMLTGEPPHSGNTAQAIIARVLTEKPRSIRSTRSSVPEYVEWTLERGLAKLPADRWATAHEFADALQGHSTRAPGAGATTASLAWDAGSDSRRGMRGRLRDPLVLALAAVAIAAVGGVVLLTRQPVADSAAVVRFMIATPDSQHTTDIPPWPAAISPDGHTVVYAVVAKSTGVPTLYALRIDQLDARPLPGTGGAAEPVFSPDGQWVGFEAGGKFKKVRLDAGAPIVVSDGSAANGLDWTSEDEIIFGAEDSTHALLHMNAAGGPRVPFTKIDAAKGETDHLWPLALADGKTVVFVIYYGALSTSKLAMTSIADGKITPLGINGIRPLALLDGNLVYVQADGTIMAVPLDVRGRRVTGTALPVLDPVVVPSSGGNGNSAIFVSRSGALVQSRGTSTSQLAWIGRDGASHVFVSELRGYSHPRLSPDGRRVTVSISDSQSSDIFVYDLATSTLTRLTSTNSAFAPSWSPDGRYVFYLANIANAKPAVFRQLADGGSPAERLAATEGIASDFALSPDGKSILVTSFTDSWDILLTRLDSGAKSRPYLNTKASEVAATFSPDGRWVAVTSDESGAAEVFVRAFPDPSTRVQVSAGGGGEPRWSADGKQLYYRTGSAIVVAKLAIGSGVQVVSRDTLFKRVNMMPASSTFNGFDITKDGSRFLSLVTDRPDLQLVVVPNWIAELRERLAKVSKK